MKTLRIKIASRIAPAICRCMSCTINGERYLDDTAN
jgi:hypothetical protein